MQRRGVSFDSKAAITPITPSTVTDGGDGGGSDHHRHWGATGQLNQTTSARGNFAHPRSSFPDSASSPARGAARVPGHNRSSSAALCGEPLLEALGKDYPGEREQLMPVYVPPQKQGGLSKATHRRSSSRTVGVTGAVDGVGGGEGDGGSTATAGPTAGAAGAAGTGAGTGAAGAAGTAAAGGASPPTSPFFAVRSPPRVLPPVPTFVSSDVSGDPAPSPALLLSPPRVKQGQKQGQKQGHKQSRKPQHMHVNRAVESKFEYDYGSLPPAVDGFLDDQGHPAQARQGLGQGQLYRADGVQDSRRDGALSVSAR